MKTSNPLPIAPQVGARVCGSCNLCCKLLPIPELEKPAGVPCRYLAGAGAGCSIYHSPERPARCHEFTCGWLRGVGPDSFAPYLSGVVIMGESLVPGCGESPVLLVVLERPARRPAAQTRVLEALHRMVLGGGPPVLVTRGAAGWLWQRSGAIVAERAVMVTADGVQ